MEDATDFIDKTGKQIYIGDPLQFSLGKFAKKSSGPELLKVVRFGKRVQIVGADDREFEYGGRNLTQQVANYSVIVDRDVIR